MNTYEEIYHFGIKGQKWGVRRFQNADGTLTRAGKKRYATLQKGLAGMRKESSRLKDYASYEEEKRQAAIKRYGGKNGWKNALEDEYGYGGVDNIDDPDLLEYEMQAYGVNNVTDLGKELAKAYMRSNGDMNVRDFYLSAAKDVDKLITKYENMPLDELTKEDLKNLKKLGKNA